jgi:hypothetical protein
MRQGSTVDAKSSKATLLLGKSHQCKNFYKLARCSKVCYIADLMVLFGDIFSKYVFKKLSFTIYQLLTFVG